MSLPDEDGPVVCALIWRTSPSGDRYPELVRLGVEVSLPGGTRKLKWDKRRERE